MMVIPEYQVKEKLYESYNSYIYRAFHEETKLHVIIKVLKGEYPNPERIVRFKREYEILKGINLEGVIKAYSLEKYNNSYAFIMEDFHAESIKNILEKRKLNLNEFFKLSIKITEILGQLHQLNIIHKNINPTNIVWNQETDQVKIIDFGISTVLSQEIAAIQNPYEMEGTLSYISPEQTGRMNRMIDYRTDMYSLGVTLYEIVTGHQPFPARDAMDLVHCHIAKNPPAPHLFKSRLLTEGSKGLEIHIPIVEKRGYFISGKFDRLKHNIPYSALTQAFQDLIRQILIESESQIKQWKTKILDAVGPNGQVIIDVIPEVELIIGKQPAVPELPPQDTQNRFNTYFQNFIRTFASESHPLSIFLDDLQWTDIPTLKLLERLMLDSRTRYMFIIGAYRDNEVDPSHPLIISLNKIKNGGAIVNYITLLPLEARHINH